MHVLVVEDDPDTRELLQQALKNAGHEVYEALCVHDALRLSRKHSDIDVVVVDVHPGHRPSSMEVAQEMRRQLPNGHCIVASGDWDTLESSCRENMTVLRKPYGKSDLLRALERCAVRFGMAEPRKVRA
jgi:DNA-binding NtrC family response regulator